MQENPKKGTRAEYFQHRKALQNGDKSVKNKRKILSPTFTSEKFSSSQVYPLNGSGTGTSRHFMNRKMFKSSELHKSEIGGQRLQRTQYRTENTKIVELTENKPFQAQQDDMMNPRKSRNVNLSDNQFNKTTFSMFQSGYDEQVKQNKQENEQAISVNNFSSQNKQRNLKKISGTFISEGSRANLFDTPQKAKHINMTRTSQESQFKSSKDKVDPVNFTDLNRADNFNKRIVFRDFPEAEAKFDGKIQSEVKPLCNRKFMAFEPEYNTPKQQSNKLLSTSQHQKSSRGFSQSSQRRPKPKIMDLNVDQNSNPEKESIGAEKTQCSSQISSSNKSAQGGKKEESKFAKKQSNQQILQAENLTQTELASQEKVNQAQIAEKSLQFTNTRKSAKVLSLKTRQKKQMKFNIYEDTDLGLDQLKKLQIFENDNFIKLNQDDDVDTDEEILKSGLNACFKDLIKIKNLLGKPHDYRQHCRGHDTWSKAFKGSIPMKDKSAKRIRFRQNK